MGGRTREDWLEEFRKNWAKDTEEEETGPAPDVEENPYFPELYKKKKDEPSDMDKMIAASDKRMDDMVKRMEAQARISEERMRAASEAQSRALEMMRKEAEARQREAEARIKKMEEEAKQKELEAKEKISKREKLRRKGRPTLLTEVPMDEEEGTKKELLGD